MFPKLEKQTFGKLRELLVQQKCNLLPTVLIRSIILIIATHVKAWFGSNSSLKVLKCDALQGKYAWKLEMFVGDYLYSLVKKKAKRSFGAWSELYKPYSLYFKTAYLKPTIYVHVFVFLH